ncbi:CMP-N-acetylneuraminate-beta-galactosamide-alpha-2,3-sialyltransferase 1-like [Cottoperca gobio]|uniref:CMP-N-acetylneuraminate-beta-galactosamide-alpha-2,3-sialyltransferase 1 n=1 Tax=Cottoperca gobio TaxID=56716 RepID=A0A6J2QNA5_COTGO|nr:CMP-N-acetylneuraminate-beta-galactosamide-alpha-2,3-sialyltransferase 1-like [Cottoperca gobio]
MLLKVKVLVFLLGVTSICMFWRAYMPMSHSVWASNQRVSEEDQWLMKHLSKSVEPFLAPNFNLEEDTFNWWKYLQSEKRSFSTFKRTADELFQMFPHIADVKGSGPKRRTTCAVVGNSGNLKKSQFGPLIDFHDVIIRMNNGRTKGYEADVGSRTTHHVMYPESAMDLDNTTHLVLLPFKILDLEWVMKALGTGFSGKSYMPIKSKIKANKDLVMVLNPAFVRYVHEIWLEKKGKYPSTGFVALVLALHICDEVDVFGFGTDNDGNWSHYWEILRNKALKTGVHHGHNEYGVIQKLAQHHQFRFYKRF